MFSTGLILLLLLPLALLAVANPSIESWLNFQCPKTEKRCFSNDSDVNLIYSKLFDDKNGSIHFLWSTIGNFPGFFVVRTNDSQSVDIDWQKLLTKKKSSVRFNSPIVNTVGVLFSKMFYWEDKDNVGRLDEVNQTFVHLLPWDQFVWSQVNGENWKHNNNSVTALFTLKHNHNVFDGNISIELKISNLMKRNDAMPHLWISPNSVHFHVIVDNMTFDKENVRLGFELMLFTRAPNFTIDLERSLDDEYSPGVFQVFNMIFNGNRKSNEQSYLQWKPVIYSTPQSIISKMLVTNITEVKTEDKVPNSNGPVYGFYSGLDEKLFKIHKFNVTFGTKGENFYSESNYTSWSYVVGMGAAPEDHISLLIKLIILVPVAALLLSPFAFCIAKRRKKNELLLSSTAESDIIRENI